MSDDIEIGGGKLRKAILIVWFLNRFNKKMSTSAIRKMVGYQGSGLYSAMEGGWFKEVEGNIRLTPKAERVCKTEILPKYNIARMFGFYIFYTMFLLFINEYIIINYEHMFRFNLYVSLFGMFFGLVFFSFFYRIIWLIKFNR